MYENSEGYPDPNAGTAGSPQNEALSVSSGWSVTHWLPLPEARKEDNHGD